MITPLPFILNDANLLKRLRLAAADTARIVTMPHAVKRMKQRKVTLNQVVECPRKGMVSEPAHLTPFGDWKATISHRCGGGAGNEGQRGLLHCDNGDDISSVRLN